eukprot:1357317-Amorphochlora_amoeboformis.AAC.1
MAVSTSCPWRVNKLSTYRCNHLALDGFLRFETPGLRWLSSGLRHGIAVGGIRVGGIGVGGIGVDGIVGIVGVLLTLLYLSWTNFCMSDKNIVKHPMSR